MSGAERSDDTTVPAPVWNVRDEPVARFALYAVVVVGFALVAGGSRGVYGDPVLTGVVWGSAVVAVVVHGVVRVWWQAPGWAGLSRRPPGMLLTLLAVPPAAALVAAASAPDLVWLVALPAALALFLIAALWIVRTASFLLAVGRERATGSWAMLLSAPLLAGALVVILSTDAPFQVRWELSAGAFAEMADVGDELMAAAASEAVLGSEDPQAAMFEDGRVRGSAVRFDAPDRVGLFEIRSGAVTGGTLLLYERTSGAMFGGAGFAYAPGGYPGGVRGDIVTYERIEGDWYSFTYAD